MPDLASEIIEDLTTRVRRFLNATGGYEHLDFLAAGGSAAVYRVVRNGNSSALKAFNPRFFSGAGGDAERHRLDVQKRLIGHGCTSLVQTYQVIERRHRLRRNGIHQWPQLTTSSAKYQIAQLCHSYPNSSKPFVSRFAEYRSSRHQA